MTVECLAPDPQLGVALRLSNYLDCQSLALGENGFQALAGGPAMTAILSGVVTIFVALIGYRMILGSFPGIRDGIGWALRLGIVLALVTSWPAFQTLVYRVVTDGPQELAAIILPAAGLSPDSMDERIQGAYDLMRLGLSGAATPTPPNDPQQASAHAGELANGPTIPPSLTGLSMPPLPQTASLFVVSTTGLAASLRLVVGFLVAIGPLAILCLLFAGTISVFDGWVRALIGAAVGVVATSVTTAIELVALESEFAHIRAVQAGADAASSLDPQAFVTIVLVFLVVALVSLFSALRVTGAFRLPMSSLVARLSTEAAGHVLLPIDATPLARPASSTIGAPMRARSAAVADALTAATYREQEMLAGDPSSVGLPRPITMRQESPNAVPATVPLGVAGRRSIGRRTQSARRRDRPT